MLLVVELCGIAAMTDPVALMTSLSQLVFDEHDEADSWIATAGILAAFFVIAASNAGFTPDQVLTLVEQAMRDFKTKEAKRLQ